MPTSPTALVFVDDQMPGCTRKATGKGFAYFDVDGNRIRDRDEIARLNAVGLPPAYDHCWFCPAPNGHILATGIDAKGRKQYRYHPEFRAQQEGMKFDGCALFGRRLPLVRARIDADLSSAGLGADRAIASVVRLLDTGGIRIGNEAYAKANRSFGATTLRMRHAAVKGATLRLRYRGKSGQQRELAITDRSLVRFVRKMQDLPGQHLFQYLASDGTPTPVTSTDVNAYLRDTMGENFTAKHFRTWTASALAFETLACADEPVSARALADIVSDRLGNTPSVARKSYIHPAMIALATDPAKQALFRQDLALPRATRWLSRHERGLIDHLEAGPSALEHLVAAPA